MNALKDMYLHLCQRYRKYLKLDTLYQSSTISYILLIVYILQTSVREKMEMVGSETESNVIFCYGSMLHLALALWDHV